LFGIINALPSLLFSDEALMPWVAFNAQPVRQGVYQRGAGQRQCERLPGPLCPDTLAKKIVKLNVRDLEGVFNGAIRALDKAGIFGQRVTGIADGTDLETTDRYRGYGQVTRTRRLEDTRGRMQDIEVTVYGWNVLLLIDAATKSPLAVKVGKIREHESHWTRALVTQAQANLARDARLHKVVVDQGLGMAQTSGGWTSRGSPVSCRQKRTWP
jgi:hypothetical protein